MRQSENDRESLFKATAPRLVRVYKVHRHLIRVVLFSLVSVSAFNFDNRPASLITCGAVWNSVT